MSTLAGNKQQVALSRSQLDPTGYNYVSVLGLPLSPYAPLKMVVDRRV